MRAWQTFVDAGIAVINDMDERRTTREDSIVFPNGWVGSIVPDRSGEGWSVAMCDWNGYFDWDALKPYGRENGTIYCATEEDVCEALTIIQGIKNNNYFEPLEHYFTV